MTTYKRYDYDYPDGLDFHPDSELHKKLLVALTDRIKRGYAAGSSFRERFRKLDHLQTAYVPDDDYTVLDPVRDPKTPMKVVIPVSRANLDTMVAYEAGVLFGDPTGMYPLQARSSKESMLRAAKMERLLNVQAQWFGHKLSHFTMLRDANLYGISAVSPVWAKHKRRETVIAEVSDVLYQMMRQEGIAKGISIGDLTRYLDTRVVHEGTELENIDVYSLIIDPHAKLNKYQKAEFMGYWKRTNAMNLLQDESDDEMGFFNCKNVYDVCKVKGGRSDTAWDKESGRFDNADVTNDSEVPGHSGQETTNEVDVAYLKWKLIPSEWGLGSSDYPELWGFAVAFNEIIIKAEKLDYEHGMFDMVMNGPQTCGYDLFPVSSLSATYGIHQFIDWKVRMHYWNASRVNNSMFVLDGSAINAQDFKKAGPRQIIRLKRPLYGDKQIQQYIQQLNVADHTNDYPMHVQSMMQFNDYCIGTNAITQGDMSNMPERPTQWGLQSATQAALSRLNKDCQMITEQSYYTLVQQMAHNNVQYLDQEMIVRIIGSRYEKQIRKELGMAPDEHDISVGPWDMDLGAFEIEPLNRMTKETDLSGMSNVMDRMLSDPNVMAEIFATKDVSRMFDAFVRKMGFENMQEYEKVGGQPPQVIPQVMPDEQVMAQQQAGNLVPAGAIA